MHLHVIADVLFKTGVETQDLGLERTLETRKSKLLPTAGTLPLKTDGHSAFESSPRSGTLFGGLTFLHRIVLRVTQNLPYSNVQPPVRGLFGIMAKIQAIEPERMGFKSWGYHLPDKDLVSEPPCLGIEDAVSDSAFPINVRIRETAYMAWNMEDTH